MIGLFAYYSLVVDRTAIHAGDRVFYLSHYLYWILTQPMLFVAVALAALPPLSNPGDRRLRASLFGGLVGAAVAWTSAGLFEAWAQSEGERWAWFGLAVAGLAAVVWQLWFPVLHQGQIKGGEHLRDYGLSPVGAFSYWAPVARSGTPSAHWRHANRRARGRPG